MEFKQVIVARKDLKMPPGKLATQVAHASVEAVLKSEKEVIKSWNKDGSKKVVLKVNSEKELIKLNQVAKDLGIKTALIKDAAKTFFKSPTITCLCIGPDEEQNIDKVTGNLPMY